jgi:hypothetical protein
MRVKKNRAIKKTCKTCCFKHGIKCGYPHGIDFDNDDECLNKIHIFWWVDDDKQHYIETRNNWKRLHRKLALIKAFERIRFNTEWHELKFKP